MYSESIALLLLAALGSTRTHRLIELNKGSYSTIPMQFRLEKDGIAKTLTLGLVNGAFVMEGELTLDEAFDMCVESIEKREKRNESMG